MTERASDSAYAFIDGGYLRRVRVSMGVLRLDPLQISRRMLGDGQAVLGSRVGFQLRRVLYFDARHEDDVAAKDEDEYRADIELLPDTELGWGTLRGSDKKPPRQKRVDTLLATRMLVGAFTGLFDTALLVAVDEDFVPVVEETRRFGVRVILGVVEIPNSSPADALLRCVDRVVRVSPQAINRLFIPPRTE